MFVHGQNFNNGFSLPFICKACNCPSQILAIFYIKINECQNIDFCWMDWKNSKNRLFDCNINSIMSINARNYRLKFTYSFRQNWIMWITRRVIIYRLIIWFDFIKSIFKDYDKLSKCSIMIKTYDMSQDNRTCYSPAISRFCDRQCRHIATWRHE